MNKVQHNYAISLLLVIVTVFYELPAQLHKYKQPLLLTCATYSY
jgi:hypothetical protein